jgi:PAS domain S-box-containing protein
MKKPVKKTKTAPSPASVLRKKAEKTISKKTSRPAKKQATLPPEKTRRMLHELQVHQIELEMQNEEMRRTQAELEVERARYFDLYDLAPVGYCTISEQGLILEANLTAAALLNMARGNLLKKLMTRFILKEDQDIYHLHLKKLFDSGELLACDLRMVKKDGTVFWAHLAGYLASNEDGTMVCRVVMSDIHERKRVEEKLRCEEERFRILAEQSSDIIVIVNREGFVTYENHAVERSLGLNSGERIGVRIFERIHPDDLKVATDTFNDFTSNKFSKDIYGPVRQIRIRHHDGSWRTFETMGSKLLINNTAESVIINLHDITERIKAEDALRESEKQYRTFFNTSRDCVYITSINGHWIDMNDAAAELFGYTSRDELMRVTIPELYATPEDRTKHINTIMEHGYAKDYPVDLRRKDGGIIHVLITSALRYDAQGKAIALMGTIKDITERKRTEAALHETERQLTTLVDNLPDCISRFDSDCRHTFVNNSVTKVFSATRDYFIGRALSECGAPGENSLLERKVRQVFEEGTLNSMEIEWQTSAGARYFDITHIPERDQYGRVVSVLGIAHDITERKKAEEELKKYREHLEELVHERTIKLEATNKELEAFSYSASHDLRAPLRTIDGFSQALLEDFADKLNTQGKDYLTRIRKATRLMAELIEDMLKLSRITRTDMDIVNVDISQIARSVINELEKSQPERKINIKIADGLEVLADPRLMRIVLENLLGNAWKFTEKNIHAEIELGITTKDGGKAFFIRDNGVGFDMDYADKLFAPFQRLHNAEEYPGTGVGLATVQRIINRHGGKTWAEGKTGEGATFYFSLHKYKVPGL